MSKWLIDTHCHLDLFKDIQSNIPAEDNLPIKTITVTNAPSFYEHNLKLFKGSKNIRVALGLHPELVPLYKDEISKFEELLHTTRYIGEIGLDGSEQHAASFVNQVAVFTKIVSLVGKADNKILTIHSRNAVKETIEILSRILRNTNCKVIFHWYTGDIKSLQSAIDQGYYFSVNHKMVVTKKGEQILRLLPIDKILTETDGPFTLNSELNRQESLEKTISFLATFHGMSNDSFAEQVYVNFQRLL